jgi:activating signal cointegrator 1
MQFDLFERPPSTNMAAVTVWAPFSILIAKVLKRFETRSWPLPARVIGQRIAIHSAARAPTRSDCTPSERTAIEKVLGVPAERWATLLRSAIVATVRVAGCHEIAGVDGGRVCA